MKVFLLFIALATYSVSGRVLETGDDWWEYGHFYQIYPRSFKDGSGDGVGDLKGIIENMSYLKTINVTGVWLSPIFTSPMKDFGYDIADFRDIDPVFGTLKDFEQLTARAKELDIKIILDFVPNHSSDLHEWFKASADPKHPEHQKYKDYYIWNSGKVLANGTRVPPSNWLSIFRGSAWEWHATRQQYYLHQFLEEQPDLNYRNPAVANEMKEVLRFWLRKGVSGFRCDTVPNLFEVDVNEAGYYDDEPTSGECEDDPDASCHLKHTKTQDQNETYDMIYQWREVMEEEEFSSHTRILMTEAYTSLENNLRYYGKVENGKIVRYGSQIPFNFDMIMRTNKHTKAPEFKEHIESWIKGMPKGKGVHANWVIGNHDQNRVGTRYSPTRIDLLNILLKTLPGITVTFYGEEIGMTDVWISWKDTQDPQACRTNPEVYHGYSRDPARTPFQWNGEKNAGFSKAAKTWLPVANNYTECNIKLEESQDVSHLKVFRGLLALRQGQTLKYGDLEINAVNDDVLVYKRSIKSNPTADVIVVVLNLGNTKETIDLNASLSGVPKQLNVAVASIHSDGPVTGDTVDAGSVAVGGDVGLVLVGRNE